MNQIKKARMIAGLTQGELAEQLGISPVQVSKWEHGKSFPAVKRLKQVSEVLNVPVADLIEERAV